MSIYSSIMAITSWCGTCRAEMFFEQPDCVEDHGAGCSEWACVECGAAILVGFEPAVPRAAGTGLTTHVA